MAKEKDPTIKSDSVADASADVDGTHPAVPVEKGADWVGNKEYRDNPDAPEGSIAQVEVLPEDK